MISLWQDTSKIEDRRRLDSDIHTQVLIIGAGLAGILTGYFLKLSGIECIIVDADKIAGGVSKDTTAKITSMHGLIYNRIIKEFGVEKAGLYLNANEEAVEKYRELCNNINCDFENKEALVYSLENKQKLEEEMVALDKLGYNYQFMSSSPLPFNIVGAIKFINQGQFNPLKFISEISKELKVYQNTKVYEIVGKSAYTSQNKITADKIIVTTHFPIINTHGSYFLKMYQQRSYVIALENCKNVEGMYIDQKKNGLSFRNYKDLLLIGGGGHRTGKKGGNWQELREFAKAKYPDSIEKYFWAAQDCMTLDGVPYIGKYSKKTDNLYVATGFNKWGITSSMVAATLLRDIILGKENIYKELFSPSRTILRPQLFVNSYEATINLVNPRIKRCSHMGCGLKWNKIEHTWDCPCHGSRFTEEGKIIDNPAKKNLKNKDEEKKDAQA